MRPIGVSAGEISVHLYVMPTANERKALLFLAVVALSGSGVRLWRAKITPATAAESDALERQIHRVDSVRDARHKPKRDPKPPASAEAMVTAPLAATSSSTGPPALPVPPVDLDRATAEEIEALPSIGPALARRIVGNRDSVGAFGELAALCDVRGVGMALVERLRPLVTFTGPHRHLSAGCGEALKKPRKTHAVRSRKTR